MISIVATPIGNLEDLTFRALRTLTEADLIACEDTRVTTKLLAHYKIPHKPLVSLHHHSSAKRISDVIAAAQSGQRIAYVCDAGTPGMNDPGGKLVEAAVDAGVAIETIPGPSSLTAAIAACGFAMEHFAYEGFVPLKKHRATTLKRIAEREETSIFLESTHRILKTLKELSDVLDDTRKIYVGRELTKKFETHYRGNIEEVRRAVEKGSVRGEFVIVIGGTR
jgi:16S rRNA (cytidine1402-2'-O)-methyltransferase